MNKEEWIESMVESTKDKLQYGSLTDIRRELMTKRPQYTEELGIEVTKKDILQILREASKKEIVEPKKVDIEIDRIDDILNQVIRIKLTDANRRQQIYDAWEEIDSKYEPMKETFKDALNKLDEEKEVQDIVDDLLELLNKPLDYIMDLDPKEADEPDEFEIALELVIEFSEMIEKAKREGSFTEETRYTEEGQEQYVTFDAGLEDEFDEEFDEDNFAEQIVTNKISIDPLYDLLIDSEIVKTPLTLNTLEQNREIIRRQGAKRIVDWDKGTADEWFKWFDNFKVGVESISPNAKFYLPLTNSTEKYFSQGDSKGNEDNIRKFMEKLSDLLMEEKASWQTTTVVGGTGAGLGATFTPASKGKSRDIEGLEDALTLFKDYYGAVRGKFFVDLLGEMPSWARDVNFENVSQFNIDKFSTQVLTSFNKKLIGGMGDLETQIKQLTVIIDFLDDFMKGGTIGGISEKFYNSIKRKNSKVQRAFAYFIDDLDEIEQFLANALMVKLGDNELPEKFSTINGKNVIELAEEWEETPEDIIASLDKAFTQPKYLMRYFDYKTPEGTKIEGAILSDRILTIDVNRLEGDKQKELFRTIQNFIKIARAELTGISKSVDSKLLQAHDLIRKMKGLPIVKAYNSLDDISDMESVIFKVEKRGYNLTATEINSIVTEIGSHSDISKQYGVSEDIVYFVKGMFR